MSSPYQQLEVILEKLNLAIEIISDPDLADDQNVVQKLLWDAYEIWCALEDENCTDDVAKDLWDLHDNLSAYYEDCEEEDSLICVIDKLREIYNLVANKQSFLPEDEVDESDLDNDSGVLSTDDSDESDRSSEDDSEDDSVDESADEELVVITKDSFREKRNKILDNIILSHGYYGIADKISAEELTSIKWKTYFYLRKCVLDYRAGRVQELTQILIFLENKNNKKWLSKELLDKPEQASTEKWGSGYHEWLERSLIVEVLKRSAGMVFGVEQETNMENEENFDWLYVQAFLRTPTKYLFFKLDENVIKEGHSGAVKPNLKKKGFSSKGSPGFHKQLEEAFKESSTITSFLQRVHNIFKEQTISGKKPINAAGTARFLVDGTKTNDEKNVNVFRRVWLRPDGYDLTNQLIKLSLLVASNNSLCLDPDIPLVDSDSSEDEGEGEAIVASLGRGGGPRI